MSPIISFDGCLGAGAAASTGVAGVACGTENSPHCSAVSALFTLTLKNAEARSLFGYADSGTATAATATPPGCTKSIGTGSDDTSSSAASPVFSVYFRGYWNESPEVLSA